MKMRYFSPKFGFIFILSAGLFNTGFKTVRAQDAGLDGQLAGWGTCQPENAWQTQIGLRYIPLLSMNRPVTETINLDIEASANMYGIVQGGRRMRPFTQGEIRPYRLWLRISSPRQEIRLGLQKINFGSAVMLRPLMWFDRLDPRDPLQITDGVYGFLGRYFFRKKTNLWLWALYGNDDVKGWEFIPTREHTVEWGGRLQVPVPEGEIALSYHQRGIDPEKAGGGIFGPRGTQPEPADWNLFDLEPVTERRIGFDGKWD